MGCIPSLAASGIPLVVEAAHCRGSSVLERTLPRHLRTHDALAVGVPFLPGALQYSRLLHRQLLVARIPAGNDRYSFDATPGPNIHSKRSSLLPDPPATALSGCSDRCYSACVSWGDACPIGFFAASAFSAGSGLRSIFCKRRASPAPIRVVRFSRLIGKLDTTGSHATAQVVRTHTLAVQA